MVWGLNHGRSKRFSLLNNHPDQLWDPPNLQWVPGSSWEVKWFGHEVDHSPPSSARVKSEWRFTCIPPACLGDMNRDSFLTCFNMVQLLTWVLISP